MWQKELQVIPSPPGLGQIDEEEESELGELPVQPGGDLLAVAQTPRGNEEARQEEKAREYEGEEGGSEEKEGDGGSKDAHTQEQDKEDTGDTERRKEEGGNEQEQSETSRTGEGREKVTTGDEGTGGEDETGDKVSGTGQMKGRGNKQGKTRSKGSNQREEEHSERTAEDGKLPMDRVFPTPDEAEWAAQKLMDMGMSEEIHKVIDTLRESSQETLAHLRQHQAEMVCKYWALRDLGINMPEEGEQEARGTWHWNERTWTWEWADNKAGEDQEGNEEQEGHQDEEWKYGPSWGTEEWEESGWQDNPPQTETWPASLRSWSGDEWNAWKYADEPWEDEKGNKNQWAEEIGDGHWWEANGGEGKAIADEWKKEQEEDGENEVAEEESESEVSIEGEEGEGAEGGEPWEADESSREETRWEGGGENKEGMEGYGKSDEGRHQRGMGRRR
jgi:hypothetical protein